MGQKYPHEPPSQRYNGMLSCLHKRRHTTVESAWHAVNVAQQKWGREFHSYYCSFCRGYHIGNAVAGAKEGEHGE